MSTNSLEQPSRCTAGTARGLMCRNWTNKVHPITSHPTCATHGGVVPQESKIPAALDYDPVEGEPTVSYGPGRGEGVRYPRDLGYWSPNLDGTSVWVEGERPPPQPRWTEPASTTVEEPDHETRERLRADLISLGKVALIALAAAVLIIIAMAVFG